MVLYKKSFPLGKDLSFLRYIEALDEKNFPPYVWKIKKIPSTENYCVEIACTYNITPWGIPNYFSGYVLFNPYTIKYSENQNNIVIEASVSVWNLFVALLIGLPTAILLFIVINVAINKHYPVSGLVIVILTFIVLLWPTIATCVREIKLINKIGLLATELTND